MKSEVELHLDSGFQIFLYFFEGASVKEMTPTLGIYFLKTLKDLKVKPGLPDLPAGVKMPDGSGRFWNIHFFQLCALAGERKNPALFKKLTSLSSDGKPVKYFIFQLS